MNLRLFIYLSFFNFTSSLFSQNQICVDSLNNQLKYAKSDIEKVNILNGLTANYQGYKASEKYIQEALNLSKKSNYTLGYNTALMNYGIFYASYHGDKEMAHKYFTEAITLCEESGNTTILPKLIRNRCENLSYFEYFDENNKLLKKAMALDLIIDTLNYCLDLEIISNNFLLVTKNFDSAFFYKNIGLHIANKSNNDFLKFTANQRMANLYYHLGNYSESEKYKQTAFSLFYKERTLHEKSFDWLCQMAWMYCPSNENDTSIVSELERSIYYARMACKIKPYDNEPNRIRLQRYSALAHTFFNKGDLYNAKKTIIKALDDFNKPLDRFNVIEFYITLGLCTSNHNYYDKAYVFFKNAESFIKLLDEPKLMMRYLDGISNIYMLISNYQKYIDTKQQKLKLAYREKAQNSIIEACISISWAGNRINEVDSALFYINLASELNKKLDSRRFDADILNNYALIFEKRHEFNKAIEYNLKAIEIAKKYQVYDLFTPESNLARIYYALNEYANALKYALMAVEKNKSDNNIQNKSYYNIQIKEDYQSLYLIYKALNKPLEALKSYELMQIYKDRLQNQKSQIALQDKIADENEIKISGLVKQNQLKQENLNQQKYIIYGSLTGTIILSFLLFFIIQNYRQKKAANHILIQQKDEILTQSEEIASQRDTLFQQKKDITDSIEYARFIQEALLSSHEVLDHCHLRNFILYKPRDIISGDFYWFKQIKNYVYFTAADCTGHGVPGAFMSVLGISLLNEIVSKRDLNPPAMVLNELRKKLKKSLKQDDSDSISRDGMDISLCLYDIETKQLQFAGAYNPLFIIRNNELIEIEANKMPVSVHPKDKNDFTNQEIQLQQNDSLYLFTDGYISQFGGPDGKKINMKIFKNLLLNIQTESIENQNKKLDKFLLEWQGRIEQVDDVLVIGVRV